MVVTTEPKAVKSNIQRAIAKIKKLDVKQKDLQTKADQILSTSAVGQAPPVYHRTLDKAIEITKKKAQIWNDEIRNKVIPGTGRTYWQVAVESRFPTVRFGKEEYLDFFAEDIEAMSTPVTSEVTKEILPGGYTETKTLLEDLTTDSLTRQGLLKTIGEKRLNEIIAETKQKLATLESARVVTPKASVTPKPKAEKGEEVWEMTRAEYYDQQWAKRPISISDKAEQRLFEMTSFDMETKRAHKSAVQQALSEGKPVPAEVLKDYPDLKPVTPEVAIKPINKKVADLIKGREGVPAIIKDDYPIQHLKKGDKVIAYPTGQEELGVKTYDILNPDGTLSVNQPEVLFTKTTPVTPEVTREAVGNLKVGDTFTGKLGTGFPEVELWEKIAESPRKGVTIRNVSTGETRTLNPVQAVYMREPAPKPKVEKVRKVKPLPIHNQTEWEAIPIGARKDTARVAGLKSKVGLKGWGGLTENEKLALRSFPHPYGKTTMELQRIHSKRTPLSQASDERQKHQVTIEPDSPRVKQWIKDPGTADISGIDTPPISKKVTLGSKRVALGRKGSPRVTPKTPRLRR